jgi:hypothetical protein
MLEEEVTDGLDLGLSSRALLDQPGLQRVEIVAAKERLACCIGEGQW